MNENKTAKKPMRVPLWLIAVISFAMAYVYAIPLGKEFFGGILAGLGLSALAVDWGLRQKAKADKKKLEKFGGAEAAVSPVIGVILMVAITVVLAAIVFVLVTQLSENTNTNSPRISFQSQEDGATLMVVSAPANLDWSDFAVTGCTTVPTGAVDAGDKLEVCAPEVIVTHTPSNSVVYSR